MIKNVPVAKPSQDLSNSTAPTSSLLGRGLTTIQSRQSAIADQHVCYRKARDVYDRITDYGLFRRFDPEILPNSGAQIDLPIDDRINQLQPLIDQTNQLASVFIQLKQLADENYGKAYFVLGRMYWGGQGISKDVSKKKYFDFLALEWLSNHCDLNDPEIWRDLGWMYKNSLGKEAQEAALFWYSKAAEQGDAHAQFNLSCIYGNGQGVTRNDQLALFWCRKAAEQGNVSAQFNLACKYQEGRSVEQNDELATFWYLKASEQGYARAQFNLACQYYHGRGVEQDNELAISWYRKAAEQGDARAQFNLSCMYGNGQGVIQNDQIALFWCRKAAEQGDAQAKEQLERLGIN